MASYKNVTVLLMHWEAEDDGAWRSIEFFGRAFENYNFNVEPYEIPFENALPSLLSALDDLEDNTARDALLIIVYVGHGGIDVPGGLTVCLKGGPEIVDGYTCNCPASHERRLNPKFSWIPVQNKINAMRHDVLTILECCQAGGAISGVSMDDVWGRKEIIAACGYKESTEFSHKNPRIDTRLTFSKALTKELQKRRSPREPFSAAVLHRNVLRRILAWNVDLGHHGNMVETPVYICVGEPGINLSKLPDKPTVAIEPASRTMADRAGSRHSHSDGHRKKVGESSGPAEPSMDRDDSTRIDKDFPPPPETRRNPETFSEKSRKPQKISSGSRVRSGVVKRGKGKQIMRR